VNFSNMWYSKCLCIKLEFYTRLYTIWEVTPNWKYWLWICSLDLFLNVEQNVCSQLCWCMPVILAHRSLKQDGEFKASLFCKKPNFLFVIRLIWKQLVCHWDFRIQFLTKMTLLNIWKYMFFTETTLRSLRTFQNLHNTEQKV
jgi:hypothetical protein